MCALFAHAQSASAHDNKWDTVMRFHQPILVCLNTHGRKNLRWWWKNIITVKNAESQEYLFACNARLVVAACNAVPANPPDPRCCWLPCDVLCRVWFNIGLVCFGINVVIMAYLTVWLPHVRGIRVSWNVYSPRAIPTATVVGLICAAT